MRVVFAVGAGWVLRSEDSGQSWTPSFPEGDVHRVISRAGIVYALSSSSLVTGRGRSGIATNTSKKSSSRGTRPLDWSRWKN